MLHRFTQICLTNKRHKTRSWLRGQTLGESTANLHWSVPLAVLAGEELVVSLQSVALVTEVLNDGLLGEAVARGGVTAVAPVLWFSGGRTHWGDSRDFQS